MRTGIYILFAILCVLAVIRALANMTKQNRKASYVPHYASLCVLFSVEPIHIALDEFIGLANLSWLLCYWCLIIGCYLAVRDTLGAWEKPPRYLKKVAIFFSIFLTSVYLLSIMHSPEYATHDYPRNVGDLVFMLGAYGYTVLLMVIMFLRINPYREILRDEKNTLVRARIFIHDTIYYLILLGFGLKFILTTILFFNGNLLYAEQLLSLSRLLMIWGGNLALLSLVVSPTGLVKIHVIRSYLGDWIKIVRFWLAIYHLWQIYKVESFMSVTILQTIIRPRLYLKAQFLCIAEMIKEIQIRFDMTVPEILHSTHLAEHHDLMLLLNQS